jgi:hypothetical protein
MQAPAAPSWAGWARCQIDVAGPGYADQQTHTWTIAGGAPTVEGAFRVYQGTWSVVGGGSLRRSQGSQTLVAQWASNVSNMSAPIAVFVRASDQRMFIQARHAQLRGAAAVQGYQQLIIDGKPQTPTKIASEAFEWAFPEVVVSRPDPKASLIANGSSTPVVNGSVGLMQPGGSRATATCRWNFNQGTAPAPPPELAARAVPTPPTVGVLVGQPAAQPPTGSAAGTDERCPTPPTNLVASAQPMVPPASTASHTITLTWGAPSFGTPYAYTVRAGSAPGLSDLRDFTQQFLDTRSSFGAAAGTYYIRVNAAAYNCTGGGSTPSNEVMLVIP